MVQGTDGTGGGMPSWVKAGIVVVLAAAVGGVLLLKDREGSGAGSGLPGTPAETAMPGSAGERVPEGPEAGLPLPCLLDLGSTTCTPCRMMIPVLEALEKEYAGVFEVRFVNARRDEAAVKRYKVRVIPTQIFLDAEGKELFRHEGFMSKEDILAKWRELGVPVERGAGGGAER